MKTRPIAVALLLSLTAPVASPPRVACAQAADEATTKMARQRFQEGVNYFDKGQYELARASFLQAYALRKHPAVLLNLAQSCVKSGHALEAARYFQQFLHEHTQATDAQRADANRGLNEARARLGRIDVIGAPAGAEIFLDDERVGVAPLDHSLDVEAGTHTVRSHGATDQTVQVTAGVGLGATARFTSGSAAPPPAAVAPPPPAAPPAEEPPPPPPETTPPPSEPPAETTPPPPADEASSHTYRGGWGWVALGAGVTVAGFATAGVMALEKQSAQNAANNATLSIATAAQKDGLSPNGVCLNPPTGSSRASFIAACSALATDNDNVNKDATIANVAIGVGVAAGVFTILYAVFGTKRHEVGRAQPVLGPMIGHGTGGILLGGSF